MSKQVFYPSIFLFLALSILLLNACQQEQMQPQKEMELGYIKGNFGAQFLDYSQTFEDNDASNVYNVYTTSTSESKIRMVRSESNTPSQSIQIHFYDLQLDTMAVPIEFSMGQNHKGYAHLYLQAYYPPSIDSSVLKAEDKSYIGMSYLDMKVRINSKADDILTGTFEGKMRSSIPRSEKEIEVKNGEFAIKIVRK